MVDSIAVDGPHGDVATRLYRSSEPPTASLVWVHGGAFAFGDLDMPESDWVARTLAARGITVLAVDYRKAVDGVHHPVPGDDVLAAWRWALANRDALGSSVPLHLGGASAGACLTAAVTKRIRDNDEVLPASLILVYPLVHAHLPPASEELHRALANAPAGAFMFDDDITLAIARNYAGDEGSLTDPYVFAGNGEHRGLPPVFIVNCEFDTLRSSGEAFAAALEAEAVPVRVVTELGAAHGHINEPDLPEAQRTLDRLVEWLR